MDAWYGINVSVAKIRENSETFWSRYPLLKPSDNKKITPLLKPNDPENKYQRYIDVLNNLLPEKTAMATSSHSPAHSRTQ